jgi:hypothetical protein
MRAAGPCSRRPAGGPPDLDPRLGLGLELEQELAGAGAGEVASRADVRRLRVARLRALYGEHVTDGDVRAFLAKRARNAARPRRRGDFPPDDAFDRPQTFAKLAPGFREALRGWRRRRRRLGCAAALLHCTAVRLAVAALAPRPAAGCRLPAARCRRTLHLRQRAR